MKKIVHTCQQGTYACDYVQGEAVKVKRAYEPPVVEVLPACVERGFQMSCCSTIVVGAEGTTDGGYLNFGSHDPADGGMLEGLGENGYLLF